MSLRRGKMKKKHMRSYINHLERENDRLGTELALLDMVVLKYKNRCQKLEEFMAEKGIHIIWSEAVD